MIMVKKNCRLQKRFFVALLILLPSAVFAGCTCEAEDEDHNRSEALKYKLVAIASTLLASFIGVCLPVLGKKIPSRSTKTNLLLIIKAFSAGVILATGFIHVLPDAFEDLTSPCLSQTPLEFPLAGFVAMMAAIVTLMVDVAATSHYKKTVRDASRNEVQAVEGDEENGTNTHASHGRPHGHVSADGDSLPTQLRYRVISQVLQFGIMFYSRIIGFALGASGSPKTVRPLVAALTFLQFFEGIGLGGCITQAKYKARGVIIMAIFFSLTTPVGIAIGIGIANVYSETNPKALILQGIFLSASAGILIYMALVALLSADFMHPKMQSSRRLQLGANVSLILGAGFMSLLAKWV